MNRSIKVSVQRKILLLLKEMNRYRDDFEVPETLSQKGIGRELNIRQNHVSRALSELRESGLVESRTTHIKDIGRRRRVYFLSKEGLLEVLEYVSSIQNRTIPVRSSDGITRSKTIKKLMKDLSAGGGSPSYYEVLVKLYDGSELDLIPESRSRAGPPISRHFHGRERELDEISTSIDDDKTTLISIISLAGMGKTTLIGELVSERTKLPINWTSMTEWMGPERLLSNWSRHLAGLGRTSLADHLNSGSWSDMETTWQKLRNDLKDIGSLFVIDDYHRSGHGIDLLMEQMIRRDLECKILIGSRTRPPFYGKEDQVVSGKVREIVLEGLDLDSSLKVLSDLSVSDLDGERIYRMTKGHPLALELAARAYDRDGISSEMENYLGKELISDLKDDERKMMFLASAYEQPVLPDGLFLEDGMSRVILESLKSKLLLREFPDGRVDLHDLIKENTRNWMGKREMENYTNMAVSYLETKGSERDILHYMTLLKRADLNEDIDRLILEMGTSLLDWDHGMVMDHIRSMKKKDLSSLDTLRYLLIRADIDISDGRTDDASRRLDEALDFSDNIDAKNREVLLELVSRIYNMRAEICRLEGRNRDVIKAHLDNVRRLEKEGTGPALGKAMNNLALAYKNAGQLQNAEKYLKMASRIFEEHDEDTSRAFVEANLSEVCLLKNDPAGAGSHLSIADRTRIRSEKMESLLKRKTGKLRMMMKDYHGAYDDLARSYNLSIDSGNRKEASSTLLDMIDISIKTKRSTEAAKNLELYQKFLYDPSSTVDTDQAWKFLDHVLSIGETDEFQRVLKYTLGNIIKWSDSRNFLKELGSRRKEFGTNAVYVLKVAYRLLEEKNESKATIIISLWLGETLVEIGKKKEGLKLIRKARKEASALSFTKAIKKADDLVERI